MLSMQKGNTRYSLCCSDVPAIIEDKFEGKKCITLAQDFELLFALKKCFTWFA